MIRTGGRLAAAVLALSLAACASAPLHYYTLVPPAAEPAAAPSQGALRFELLPVGVPAQVDQPQLVVREGGQGVAMLQGERWIAPLGDEVRAALSAGLSRQLGAQDVSGLPTAGQPVLRIKLDLRRFDSVPGSYALLEAAWSVRDLKGGDSAVAACTSRIQEPVGAGYPALVEGHQRAIAALAGQIAAAARAVAAGQPGSCR